MNAIRHILVPTDFAEPAARALELAIELASAFGAQITLLHVVPELPFVERAEWDKIVGPGPARELERAREASKARHAASDGVLLFGVPWEQIVSTATERGADLIVMGTHGRRGLPRAILGSVAEKVVRLSPVPVLTVPRHTDAPP
jgi:nucleotide-binding universal stress UspA family protein